MKKIKLSDLKGVKYSDLGDKYIKMDNFEVEYKFSVLYKGVYNGEVISVNDVDGCYKMNSKLSDDIYEDIVMGLELDDDIEDVDELMDVYLIDGSIEEVKNLY